MTKHKQLAIWACSVIFICFGILAVILLRCHSENSGELQSVVGETGSKIKLEQEKTLLELLSPKNLERERKNMKSSYNPENIQDEPVRGKKERNFLRPEERGEDFSSFNSEKLLDKLEKGDKIEQRKAANVLWDKYGTDGDKLSDEEKEKIEKSVVRYLIMSKTDFEEGFLQLQRLWHLAIPALMKNVTNTDEAVSEKSSELLTLMKTEKIIMVLIEDSDKAESKDDIKKYIFALEYLHINNPNFMEKRTRISDEECNKLYKELVIPQIEKLNKKIQKK